MSARFAELAPRWASLAAHALGWRPGEFWSATPTELTMALGAGEELAAPPPPPSREMIARMMERDADD
jgi:hypothetical protein